MSRSKDALRKHVSYRHPGTPSPCDPDTKRKRSKANLGQMIKQEMLTDQNPMSHMIKQEILGDHSTSLNNQQHHNTNQLLANLTSQGNSIVSIPSFLQQAASMQSAFSSKSLLFNSASIPASLTAPLPPPQMPNVCSLNSQAKDLTNTDLSLENTNGSPSPNDVTKASNGPTESMDESRAEDSKLLDTTP